MTALVVERQLAGLRHPVLLCAFSGWNDGGEAASGALTFLRERWRAARVASIDPEDFLDFQVNRPTVRLVDGVTRRIEWPTPEFFHAKLPHRDVLLLSAPEPNMRWRGFCDAIVSYGKSLASERLVTLGGFLADTPHTRDIRLAGSAMDEGEAERLGVSASRYEGPTGIVGVLHDVSNRVGLPSVSLWAAVPHYLPAGPNPKATIALVRKAASLLGAEVDVGELEEAEGSWRQRIDGLIAANEDLGQYVERLEEAYDLAGDTGEMPSGEALAAELERFLREREQRGPGAE